MSHLFRVAGALVCLFISTGVSSGQWGWGPQVYSVTNSASYAVSGRNGYGIAQGSLFVLFGNEIGPYQMEFATSFPLPSELGGVSVSISAGNMTANAPMIYAGAWQVAAVLLSFVPEGPGLLMVTYNGQMSDPVPITILRSAFGIYTVSSNGVGAGVITGADYRLKSFNEPAVTGETLILWGTGIGPVDGDEFAGPLPANRYVDVEVFVGGRKASVQYAGRSGCCAGVDQIAFDVPPSVQGCFVPVTVRYGGVVSNFVSLPVAAQRGTCADPVGMPPDVLAKAQTGSTVVVGSIGIGPIPVLQSIGFSLSQGYADRLSAMLHVKVPAKQIAQVMSANGADRTALIRKLVDRYRPLIRARGINVRQFRRMMATLEDHAVAAGFTHLHGLQQATAQFASVLPPPGSCTVARGFTFYSQDWGVYSKSQDAGSQLVLSGPLGARILQKISDGEYQVSLGSGFSNHQPPSGAYSVSSFGGADIGSFTASLGIGGPLVWTNKADIPWVNRSRPLTITWSGGPSPGYVLIGGASSGNDVRLAFACVEDSRKGMLTVPEYVLAALPAAESDHGSLFLAAHPIQNRFAAPGMDFGFFSYFGSDSSELAYH